MDVGDNIFVYGTLKTGQGANFILQDNRAEFIGNDRISGTMYDLGAFPGIKTLGSSKETTEVLPFFSEGPTVTGELWRIIDPDLPSRLDHYEGYPNLYGRRVVETEGGAVTWVYEYNGNMDNEYADGRLVPTGQWEGR